MHSFYGTRLSENMAKTPEGYLICYDVNIARVGTQEYLGRELGVNDEIVVVNRPANEVFKPATIASFEGKPFTNDHPYELLDVSNTSIYEKGHVQNVRISDDKTYIIADIMVKDAQTIRDIENGKRELSAGYNCDCLQDDDGNWYQCNIIGNHVALVDKGRAGNKVRINDNEWKEQDHPRAKDGKFTSGGGSGESSSSEKPKESTSSNPVSSLSEKERRGVDVALTIYGQEYQKRGNEGTYKASQELRAKVKNGEELSKEDLKSIQVALHATGAEEAKEIANKIAINRGRAVVPTEEFKKIADNNDIAQIVEHFAYKYNNNGDFPDESFVADAKKIMKYAKENGNNYLYDLAKDISSDFDNWTDDNYKRTLTDMMECIVNIENSNNKEKKPMKDTRTVLGKLLKAFAKDAEPEEMVEAIKAVKGEDVEPEGDKVAQLEAKVAELEAKLEKLYTAEKKEEQGEMHALDELEKEIVDGCEIEDADEDEEKEEIKDEDAKNDPKLIEAISEKAQADEDVTEEIKKEIADAKKVIAKIEDKETRLAVADSLARVIRGKMTSSVNYKKLMDASKTKQLADSKSVDYNAKFKEIKERHFRK